ncbi:hypothetical protein [Alkaliphilus oremlandii]|uniref:Large polyvalent-protein-associated domain-containing protein n=1 Tax=Alkaliphilus oremlandii (strain OhILAs) TaxID=350688 RepID=A8MGZ1_ALKOO|nr:hypothetical protein [Alkaliphilus oremlandii]ABW18878.1 hypothetical protein Clos_1333 [Alkaliphilus oremlandii OhILAs]
MKLQELAEEIQEDLQEGNLNFIIYKVGRQWKYEIYDSYEDDVNEEAQKKFFTIKNRIDDEAIIINGKKDFDFYDVKYIQQRIKDLI